MGNIVSKIRVKLRKYPLLFVPVKFLFNIYVKITHLPKWVRDVRIDYRKVKEYITEPQKTCWFMCVPSHANMGDQAMAFASRRWISTSFPDFNIVELSCGSIKAFQGHILKKLKKNILEDDLICIQGGYTSGDKSANERAHKYIAQYLHHNRIVFFPQTAFYTSEEKLQETALLYNEHRRIIFLARDRVSFESVRNAFSGITVKLFPDVVSTLIGNNDFELSNTKEGILLCIREDSEKKYTSSEINEFKGKLERNYHVDYIDLMMQKGNQTPGEYEEIIRNLIFQMSKYKIIVTDRFHGILFSILSKTPVIAIDSIDYKVREGALMFAELYPLSSSFAQSLNDAENMVYDFYKADFQVEYDAKCNKYYEELVDCINEM